LCTVQYRLDLTGNELMAFMSIVPYNLTRASE